MQNSSGKIDKYEHFTGEVILPYDQGRIIEEAKFTYSPLGKPFGKQIKSFRRFKSYYTKINN